MSSLVISGDTSGTVTLAAPAVAGSNTLTLQAGTATNSMNTLATAVASTSGTSITFSSIPSWVKRITVIFNGVSTSGTSPIILQAGSGSVTATGYLGNTGRMGSTANLYVANSTGFQIATNPVASDVMYGHAVLTLISGNIYICSGVVNGNVTNATNLIAGGITLGGVLDRVVLTTSGGTDTFDAGTVNILYEG